MTGSRIERSGEGPAPVQVFTKETFQLLGAATVQDVLRYTPQQPFTRAQHYYQSGAEYAQMRGIGVGADFRRAKSHAGVSRSSASRHRVK